MQRIRLIFIGLAMTVLFSPGCGNFFSGGASDVTDTYTAEFHDVPIPKDMSIEKGYTEIDQTGNMRAGHMRFSGNVELISLINASIYNMHAQGWSPLAIYKHKNGLLVFQKDERVCTMVFTESMTSTVMRVWVSPKMNGFTMPPTMPVGPAPAQPAETYEEVQFAGGNSGGSGSSGGSPENGSGSSGGGMNEQSLDE